MADVLRKALQTIILYRDGSQRVVEPGEVITLTDKEFNELRRINPDCMGKLDEAEVALIEKKEAADQAEVALIEKKEAADQAEVALIEKKEAADQAATKPASKKASNKDQPEEDL